MKLLILAAFLITPYVHAQKKPGKNRKTEQKSKESRTNKGRELIGKESKENIANRRSANPLGEVGKESSVKQDIVREDILNYAKVHYESTSARTLVEKIATAATGEVSPSHKKLAEQFITFLAEAKFGFTVMKPEIVLDAIQKWGSLEAENLAKIYEEMTARVKDGKVKDINKGFKELLRELGIEEAFKEYCQG